MNIRTLILAILIAVPLQAGKWSEINRETWKSIALLSAIAIGGSQVVINEAMVLNVLRASSCPQITGLLSAISGPAGLAAFVYYLKKYPSFWNKKSMERGALLGGAVGLVTSQLHYSFYAANALYSGNI